MERRSLLLHVCCAPCMSYVHEILKEEYSLTAYFYNPNIAPYSEYRKRLDEVERFTAENEIPLIEGPRNQQDWVSVVKANRFLGERSRRCHDCYKIRLEGAFNKALELNITSIATVLSISPHKDAQAINRIGKELQKAKKIEFLAADFKKNDGYKKSVELSGKYGFYRQDYCGCMYSRMERDKNSHWYKKSFSMRNNKNV